jgi:glucose-1-phosphate adenylyltransferase
MGADYFESKEEIDLNLEKNIPRIGIGNDCEIRNTIIDKNARVGNGVRLVNVKQLNEHTQEEYVIRDGIIVVPKNSILPDGTVI